MKKHLVFLGAFTLCFAGNITAQQWTKLGYMITGSDTAKGSHMIRGFASDVYCCTNKGLYKSADNGATWTDLTFTKANIANQKIYSVLVAANGNLFAGTEKKVFKSTDGGASWSLSLSDSATYYDLWEIGGNIVASYSKGSTNGVYYTANSGSTWSTAGGITSGVRYFLQDGTTLLLGGTASGVYKSSDNGQTWVILGTGFPATPGIWGVQKSGNKLFAYSATGSGLYESSDAGSTWTASLPSVFNGFCQIFSMAQGNGKMILSNDGACNPAGATAIRLSNDGGGSWNNFLSGLSLPNYFPVLGTNFSGSSFFAKAGNGVDTYRTDLATGLTSRASMEHLVSVFPNPATSEITITINHRDVDGVKLSLYNLLSQLLLALDLQETNTKIDLSHFERGVYLVKVEGKDGAVINRVVLE